jgi:hypothetical protein
MPATATQPPSTHPTRTSGPTTTAVLTALSSVALPPPSRTRTGISVQVPSVSTPHHGGSPQVPFPSPIAKSKAPKDWGGHSRFPTATQNSGCDFGAEGHWMDKFIWVFALWDFTFYDMRLRN